MVCSESCRRRSAVDCLGFQLLPWHRACPRAGDAHAPSPGWTSARDLGYDLRNENGFGFRFGALLAGADRRLRRGGPADPTKGARVVNVVAAENIWGDVARADRRAARERDVDHQPTRATTRTCTRRARATRRGLARANLVVVNGLGYDDFADKLLDASSSSKRRVLTIADVLQAASGSNPHLWYDAPAAARGGARDRGRAGRAGPARRRASSARTRRASSRRCSRC